MGCWGFHVDGIDLRLKRTMLRDDGFDGPFDAVEHFDYGFIFHGKTLRLNGCGFVGAGWQPYDSGINCSVRTL
jgi:hypothetical protein